MPNDDKQTEAIQKFMENNKGLADKKAEQKADDIVTLQNNFKLKINPTKIKYFKSGDFNLLIFIKEIGIVNLITKFTDGNDIISRFLSAVLDKPYISEQVKIDDSEKYETKYKFDSAIESLIENDLSVVDIETIIETALRVNKIDMENFTLPQPKTTE